MKNIITFLIFTHLISCLSKPIRTERNFYRKNDSICLVKELEHIQELSGSKEVVFKNYLLDIIPYYSSSDSVLTFTNGFLYFQLNLYELKDSISESNIKSISMIPNHGRVKIPEDELKIIKMKISILSGINIYPHGNYFMDKNKNLIRVYSSKNYFRQFVCLDNKYGSVVWIINNFKFLKKIVYFGNVSLH